MERLGWFINLRWVAIAGCLAVLLAGSLVVPLDIQYTRVWFCVFCLALFNTAYWVYARKLKIASLHGTPSSGKARAFLHFQMIADLVLLTLMLYFSGGAENPLLLIYLFHLAISAMIFSERESLFYAGLALALPWLLFLAGRLYPPVESSWEGLGALSGVHVRSVLLAYSLTVVGLWYFLSRLAMDLRAREGVLRETSGKLSNAFEQLKQLDVFKNRFLHQVVSKLKEPTIEMDFDLSEVEKAVSKEGGEPTLPIHTAKKRAWALLELIEDLAWLSRVRVEDIPFKKELIEVYATLKERIRAMEGQAQAKGITFQLNGDSKARIWADREAFNRVAVNLFSNAVKYTPAGKHQVAVEIKAEGDWLILSVQDEGIGIPAKQQSKLFQEFFRASNAKTVEKFGTGLGLSIVKQIMDWHGGKVQFASITKNGTKVETWWPATRLEAEKPST